MQLTARQKREQAYHDEYAKSLDASDPIDFACVDGPRSGSERRPWNAYWVLLETILAEYEKLPHRATRPTILDFGGGPGYYAVLYARIGYRVESFDISVGSVEFAARRAQAHGYADDIHVSVGVGEQLAYQGESFDVVCGIDILHHLDDIPAAIRECHRVLKPGGVAYFKEFFEAVAWDRIRNTRLLRKIAPNSASHDFDRYVTEDERKVDAADLRAIGEIAPGIDVKYFRILSRLNNIGLLGGKFKSAEALFQRKAWADKIDRWMIDRFSSVHRLCGEGIICFRKPAE